MLKKMFALVAFAAVAAMPVAQAEDTTTTTTTTTTKKPGLLKEAGADLKKGANAVVKGSEAVVKDSAKAVKKGADAGVHGTETVGKDLVDGTKKIGNKAEGLIKHKKKDKAAAPETAPSTTPAAN